MSQIDKFTVFLEPIQLEAKIEVRKLIFAIPADLGTILIAGCPEESFLHIGQSLLLPYLEPYLIRTMKAANELITDPNLSAQIALFTGQEEQHYQQHQRLNQAMQMDGFQLKELEKELEADYLKFTKQRSLRFNLAYAEGVESYTTAIALFTLQTNALQNLPEPIRDLFQWHLIEELEHRTVAFDVYRHLYSGYFYRLIVGLYAQAHIIRFSIRVIIELMYRDRKAYLLNYGGLWQSFKRLKPLYTPVLKYLFPKVIRIYLPSYSPHKIKLTEQALNLSKAYSLRQEFDSPLEPA